VWLRGCCASALGPTQEKWRPPDPYRRRRPHCLSPVHTTRAPRCPTEPLGNRSRLGHRSAQQHLSNDRDRRQQINKHKHAKTQEREHGTRARPDGGGRDKTEAKASCFCTQCTMRATQRGTPAHVVGIYMRTCMYARSARKSMRPYVRTRAAAMRCGINHLYAAACQAALLAAVGARVEPRLQDGSCAFAL
jgi:hypothetical protein